MKEISTFKGVLVIGAMVGAVVLYAMWPSGPRRREPPAPATVVDVGWVVTTGTQRCQLVVTEKWCDEIDPRLPNMTRRQEVRDRIRTDDCAKQERKRKRKGREKGVLDYLCTAEWKDVMGEMCRSEQLAWVPVATNAAEVHGRRLPVPPPSPAAPPCGSPGCGVGCEAPLELTAAHVVWARRDDDHTLWRCPSEPGPWNIAEPGQPFAARFKLCAAATKW